MEEDIKKFLKLVKEIKTIYTGDIIIPEDVPVEAIQNLIARYKELEKHYQHEQEYINGEVFSAKQMHYIEDNYIDKSKVKEKIEKYNIQRQQAETEKINNMFVNYIDCLQELLEEG